MKSLIIILVVLYLTSCTVTGKYFAGDGFNNTSLTLNKDHSFTFIDFLDVGGANKIIGRWSLKNNILKLNSDNKPPFIPNTVSFTQIKSLRNKLIIIQYMDISAYKVIVSLNNGAVIDSTISLRDMDLSTDNSLPMFVTGFYTNLDTLKSIEILDTKGWIDCGLTQTEFKADNSTFNYVKIFAQPYNHYYGMKYFYNTEWLIKNNRIYNWRTENNVFNMKFYLKRRR